LGTVRGRIGRVEPWLAGSLGRFLQWDDKTIEWIGNSVAVWSLGDGLDAEIAKTWVGEVEEGRWDALMQGGI